MQRSMLSRRRFTLALAAAVALNAGIGVLMAGSAGAAAPGAAGAQKAKPVATLTIIEPNASVRRKGTDEFKPATDGQRLRVGDTVQTDATGFSQINYTEDSFTRLDVNTTFTIVSLSDDEGNRKIKGSLDTGRTWNRTSALTESESFEQEGAGATAAVVGSAYLVTCVSANNCVFISVDHGLRITTVDGDVQFLDSLEACDSSEVTDTDADLCSVPEQVALEVLLLDAFFATNYFLDASLGLPLPVLTGTVEIDEFGNVTFTPTPPPAPTPDPPAGSSPVFDAECPVLVDVSQDPLGFAEVPCPAPVVEDVVASDAPVYTPASGITAEDEYAAFFTLNVTGADTVSFSVFSTSGWLCALPGTGVTGTTSCDDAYVFAVVDLSAYLRIEATTDQFAPTTEFVFAPLEWENYESPNESSFTAVATNATGSTSQEVTTTVVEDDG